MRFTVCAAMACMAGCGSAGEEPPLPEAPDEPAAATEPADEPSRLDEPAAATEPVDEPDRLDEPDPEWAEAAPAGFEEPFAAAPPAEPLPADEEAGADCAEGTPADVAEGERPALAWTGDGFLLAWRDVAGVLVVRLDAAGRVDGEPLPLGDADAGAPSVAWGGGAGAVAWSDGMVRLAPVTADGEPAGPPLALGPGEAPRLAWTGRGYGVAFRREGQLVVARLDETGAAVTDEVALGADVQPHPASLTWTGDGFAATWTEPCRDCAAPHLALMLARVPEAGAVAEAPQVLDTGFVTGGASVAPSAEGFAVAWYTVNRGTVGAVRLQRFAAGGDALDAGPHDLALPQGLSRPAPAAVWTGAGYLVAWPHADGEAPAIHLAHLSDDGRRADDDRVLGMAATDPADPMLAAAGEGFVAAWSARTAGRPVVRVARAGCDAR